MELHTQLPVHHQTEVAGIGRESWRFGGPQGELVLQGGKPGKPWLGYYLVGEIHPLINLIENPSGGRFLFGGGERNFLQGKVVFCDNKKTKELFQETNLSVSSSIGKKEKEILQKNIWWGIFLNWGKVGGGAEKKVVPIFLFKFMIWLWLVDLARGEGLFFRSWRFGVFHPQSTKKDYPLPQTSSFSRLGMRWDERMNHKSATEWPI